MCYRLTEIGPRMMLQLVKIEEGIGTGEVLYHEYIKKSPEEVEATKEMRKQKKWVELLVTSIDMVSQ